MKHKRSPHLLASSCQNNVVPYAVVQTTGRNPNAVSKLTSIQHCHKIQETILFKHSICITVNTKAKYWLMTQSETLSKITASCCVQTEHELALKSFSVKQTTAAEKLIKSSFKVWSDFRQINACTHGMLEILKYTPGWTPLCLLCMMNMTGVGFSNANWEMALAIYIYIVYIYTSWLLLKLFCSISAMPDQNIRSSARGEVVVPCALTSTIQHHTFLVIVWAIWLEQTLWICALPKLGIPYAVSVNTWNLFLSARVGKPLNSLRE